MNARLTIAALLLPAALASQAPAIPTHALIEAGQRHDTWGRHEDARRIFQKVIDSTDSPSIRAMAQRRMAMSWGFEGNCARVIEYEEMVIAYWKTRETAEPQNAFYQQGEMANEAARVCLDAGDLDAAERMYLRGAALGNLEPEPRTHPRSLWDYRTHHALARLAARRGRAGEARFHVESARRALDADTLMARGQERFYPYLTGYVALYLGDLKTAETELLRAVALDGNSRDPFMHVLLGMTYERSSDAAKAREYYQKAYDLAARGHNPPAVFTRPFARRKLGIAAPEP